MLARHWVLNADHGITNSTAVFLAATSTQSGPLCGGAVEMVYKGTERMGSVQNKLIVEVKAKKRRLFGNEHRIYKIRDPRGKFMLQLMDEYNEDVQKISFLRVAMEINRAGETDYYFTSRNLEGNADLYDFFLYNCTFATSVTGGYMKDNTLSFE